MRVTSYFLCFICQWLRWHPRGHVVLAGSEDFTSWMWNADTGACLSVFAGHNGSVTCGGFTPDGTYILNKSYHFRKEISES